MNYKSRKYKKVKKSKKNIKRGGKRSHKKQVVKKSKLGNRNYQKQSPNGNKKNNSHYLSRGGKKNISYYLSRGGKAKYTVLRNEKSPTSHATTKRVKKTQLKKYRKPFGKHSMKVGAGPKPGGPPKQKKQRREANKEAKEKRATQKQTRKKARTKNRKEIEKNQKLKKKAEGKGKHSLGIRSFGKKIGRTKNKIKRLGKKEGIQDMEKRIGKKKTQKDRLDTHIKERREKNKEKLEYTQKKIEEYQTTIENLNKKKDSRKSLDKYEEAQLSRSIALKAENLERNRKATNEGQNIDKIEKQIETQKKLIDKEIALDTQKIKHKVKNIEERKQKKEEQYATKFEKLKERAQRNSDIETQKKGTITDFEHELKAARKYDKRDFVKRFKARRNLMRAKRNQQFQSIGKSPGKLYQNRKDRQAMKKLGLEQKDLNKNLTPELKDKMYKERLSQKQSSRKKLNPADRAQKEFSQSKDMNPLNTTSISVKEIITGELGKSESPAATAATAEKEAAAQAAAAATPTATSTKDDAAVSEAAEKAKEIAGYKAQITKSMSERQVQLEIINKPNGSSNDKQNARDRIVLINDKIEQFNKMLSESEI
jgi:hypothetical protein